MFIYPFDSYFSSTKQVIFKSNQDIQYIKSFYKEWSRGDKKNRKTKKKLAKKTEPRKKKPN
jgi:hypothetical protein